MKKYLFVVLILAFVVRLIALNQSLWLDEATTARVVREYSVSQIITTYSPRDFHPPLFYIVEKLWVTVFGSSEVSLRFPSVIFSLLAGLTIFFIGKRMKSEKVGFWATVLFLFNPLIVYYSQEARMYMMVVFLLSTVLYFFVNLYIDRPHSSSNREALMYVGLFYSCFLSFLTFYGSVFFIVALITYCIYKLQFRLALRLIAGLSASILFVSPLLKQQIRYSQSALEQVVNWMDVLGKGNVKNLFLIFIKFTTGRVSFFPKEIYLGLASIWSVIVYYFAVRNHEKKELLPFLFIFPIILGCIFSLFTPLLQYFRFIYLIIPLSLLLGYAANLKWQQVLLTSGFVAWSLLYITFPMFHREDWKSLSTSLPKKKIYAIPSSMDGLLYYRNDMVIFDIRRSDFKDKQLVIVPYTSEIYGYDYKNVLTIAGYKNSSKSDFRGIGYEVWERM